MKFTVINKALKITAESPREVLEMIKHYSLDTLAHVEAIASGHLVHIVGPGKRDNGEWFPVSHTLGAEWLAPYMKRLQDMTGFSGHIADRPGPRYPSGYCVNLCHTHIVESASISSVSYTARGFIHSQDWNGRTAAQRYKEAFAGYVAANMGDVKREPEYIRMDNGWLKENPNYLKRHAPHAAPKSAAVFECLFNAWLEKYASEEQRQIVTRCMANHHTVCPRDGMGEFFLRSYDRGYRVDWGGPLVSFEEFAKLGKG